ncbi:site-specific integrase [Salipiger aestuarii]|uniref:hypothetical protein n=1 Tax=Salipiger aestuarii TaxID=568098 RepID=UPI000552B895|nr:hypothetical protein [Salipiger aestuarii]KAA8607685.1 hypothetical protein AL037_18430 [Salipiger aestuarii]
MNNTGARPSELAAQTPEQITLDHEVPRISIQPDGRRLKSANAHRKIPLREAQLQRDDPIRRVSEGSCHIPGDNAAAC